METMNTSIMTSLRYTVLILYLAVCVDSGSAYSRISMTARVGSTVVLPCEWRDVLSQSPHVEWRTFTETVFERLGEEQYQGEGYEGRVDVPEDKLKKGNCSLELKNVKPDDTGVYESYLLVNRVKRSLLSKRVFIQSVELSVDVFTPKDLPEETLFESFVATDDAGMDCLHPQIIVFSLLSYLLSQII